IPQTRDEQATLYHRELASMAAKSQRVLLVLDNVSGVSQVDGLLPHTHGHRVLITSRDTLGELDDARPYELGLLAEDEALRLLAEVLRQRQRADLRVQRSSTDARELVRLCGRLPLALRVVAALL